MSWRFKFNVGRTKDAEPVKADVKPGSECSHDWTNWTDPENTERPVHSLWGGESGSVAAQVQHRRCLKCNLAQRTFI